MLGWIRQLFSGNPGPAPAGVDVERDALGRVVSATATLSAGPAADVTSRYPPLAFTRDCRPELEAASRWLCERNMAAAQGWAIGLEHDYTFDQADGRLVLKFGHGPDLTLDAQVLGSFDPSNRSLMWGWHNSSLRPELQQAALLARAEGARRGEAALTTPVQTMFFDQMTPLLAWAAQIAGVDGVHRARTDSGTWVFLAYRLQGVPSRLAPLDAALATEALALVERHDHDQAEQDRVYDEQKSASDGSFDGDLLRRIVDTKMISWRRDWARDDDYWHPCSTSWPSDHDRTRAYQQFLAPYPTGGVLDVTIRDSVRHTVYRIERRDDALKITDKLLDWGKGFLWPRVE